uniref:Reverse transcriptase/retrotransposon-derived protein RNase H-like domain-containing protein n=1 Tax=Photinus pyralis TaxID=7054 RepID=A0A1Y1L353_PHOPY
MVGIHHKDRDALRFLWYDTSGNITGYRFQRVPFGLTSSSFHLTATTQHELNETVTLLKKGFYADDLAVSMYNIKDAKKFQIEAQQIMELAKFQLNSWATTGDERESISILGLQWDTKNDLLYINIEVAPNICYTKRTLLAKAQSVFDPIGFLCPTLVIIKLILQKAWKIKLSWDEPLPSELTVEFQEWYRQLPKLIWCRIPRALGGSLPKEAKRSLHVFVDASKSIYAACIFLRSEYQGAVEVQLIQAKNRIAPTDRITIPRMELLAALIGSRLYLEI